MPALWNKSGTNGSTNGSRKIETVHSTNNFRKFPETQSLFYHLLIVFHGAISARTRAYINVILHKTVRGQRTRSRRTTRATQTQEIARALSQHRESDKIMPTLIHTTARSRLICGFTAFTTLAKPHNRARGEQLPVAVVDNGTNRSSRLALRIACVRATIA